MPAISIITPFVPNDRIFLERAFRSVESQSTEDWEWIISEDGPTESAREIAEWDSRITWINSGRNSGPAVARNMAAVMAKSDIVRNLDADDEIAGTETIEKTINAFNENPGIQFAVGPMIDRLENGELKTFSDQIEPGIIRQNSLFEFWKKNNRFGAVHPTSLAVRTSAFFAVGGYPALSASEDTAFLFMVNRQFEGLFLDFSVTIHAKRAGSITKSEWYGADSDRWLREEFIVRVGELGLE